LKNSSSDDKKRRPGASGGKGEENFGIQLFIDGHEANSIPNPKKAFCSNVDDIFLGYTSVGGETVNKYYTGAIRNFIYREYRPDDPNFRFKEFTGDCVDITRAETG